MMFCLMFFEFVFAGNINLWNIGIKDNSCSEFALDGKSYTEFVDHGFGQSDAYYVVGRSDVSAEWPYVLPGSFDHFIGKSFWAGFALCRLPVYFEIDELPGSGNCQLVVDFLEVSCSDPPMFRAYVNGKKYEHRLPAGKSGSEPIMKEPHPYQVVFNIPVSALKKGINEIIFQNHLGKWSIFDSIHFTAPEGTVLGTPGETFIVHIGTAGFEVVEHRKKMLPMLVNLRHKGKSMRLKFTVDDMIFWKRVEEGHTILEVNLPAVSETTVSSVKIERGGKILYEGTIVREPKRTGRLVDYVDQYMGTSGSRWMIAPGPWTPMGMVKISPDNSDSRWKAGYEYQIENIMGFSHVHDWTMAGLLMMPTNGVLRIDPGPDTNPDLGYRSRIDKMTERAEIGVYSVDLTDYDIHVDLTATKRASMQRYVFPDRKDNRLLIDLHFPSEYIWELRDAVIQKVSDTEVAGYALSCCDKTGYAGENLYKLNFVIQFNVPMVSMGGWVRDRIVENVDLIDHDTYESQWAFYLDEYKMDDAGAFLGFPEGTKELKVRTGISFVSIEQARLNLTEEIVRPYGWDFDAIVAAQQDVWEKILGRVEIETDDYLQKVKFYTNMYRALSGRCTWSDVNGKWVDMNEEIQQTDPEKALYSSDGYWGTHWNLVQFNNLLAPDVASNWIHTFAEMYDKGGWLPIGNPGLEYFRVMVGQPAVPAIVSAWQMGIRDFDSQKMYKAMYHQLTSLMERHPGGGEVGNESNNYYLKLGYVPLGSGNQSYVSNTMEYAYQDWCFAQYAKSLGGHDDVYREFMKRSENWRNIYDKTSGFVRPRKLDGTWLEDFDPLSSPGFVESNSWQYTWYVPHNLPGLIKVMGKKRYVDLLNEGMETSSKVNFNALGDDFKKYPVNHGNQSNMQSCYLFNYADEPWLTQKWARAIQEKYYGCGHRNAYPGDEDQGQMSAWYVMSAMGLFQMDGGCEVNPTYDLGSPRFEKITIHLDSKYHSGKTFVINAKNASRQNKYIRSAKLNNCRLNDWKIPVSAVLEGGILDLEMSDRPDNWGKRINNQ